MDTESDIFISIFIGLPIYIDTMIERYIMNVFDLRAACTCYDSHAIGREHVASRCARFVVKRIYRMQIVERSMQICL